jgi:hypothetical protein
MRNYKQFLIQIFTDQKYLQRVKLKRSTNYKKMECFCNFEIKYCRPLFMIGR